MHDTTNSKHAAASQSNLDLPSEKNLRHKDLRCSRFPLPGPHPHLRTQLRVTVEAMVDSMPLPMEWSAIEQSEQIEKVVVEERLQEDQKQQKGHLTNWQHCLDLAIPAGACTHVFHRYFGARSSST